MKQLIYFSIFIIQIQIIQECEMPSMIDSTWMQF